MHNNIETFVKSNRSEFDTFEPSIAIWAAIDTGIQTPSSVTASKITWLKTFVFGASVVSGIAYFTLDSNDTLSTKKGTSASTVTPTTDSKEKESKITEQMVHDFSATVPVVTYSENRPVLSATAEPNAKGETIIRLGNSLTPIEKTEVIKPVFALLPAVPIVPYPIEPVEPMEPLSPLTGLGDNTIIINDTVFTGIKKVQINSTLADIDVQTKSGNLTSVSFSAEEGESKRKSYEKDKTKDKQQISYSINNDILIITINIPEKKVLRNVNNCTESFYLNLELPTDASLSINNSVGDVVIKGLEGEECFVHNSLGNVTIENCSSKLDITTSTGDVTLRENKGDLKAQTSLGDFTVDQFTGNIHMNTSTGDSKISNVTGNIELKSSLGDQKYEHVTGDVKSSCTSGDTRFSNVKGNVEINSSLGDINFENYIGNPVINSSSGDISGTNVELIDNITFGSTLGDVHFDLVNKMDDLSFDLETNIGTININKDGQKIEETEKLIINKGKIVVKGSTSSGDQSFK